MTETSQLSPAVARPSHVSEDLVFDFDLFRDPGLQQDGYARIEEIVASTPPVFWTPRNGGHWVLRGYQAVYKASRDFESFSSEFVPYERIQQMAAALPPGAPHILQPVPISVDPPVHTRYRAPLNSAFSPKTVMAMKEEIRTLAVELIEKVRQRGRCEFVLDIAEPFPVTLFLRLLGLPDDRLREYRDIAQEHLNSVSNPTPDGVQERMRKIVDAMADTLEARRAEPRGDLISRLWQLEIEGETLSLNDIENYAIVLFIGGLDTVVNGMAHGIRHLALNPDLQDRLRANPALIPEAAEELLRRYTFTVPPRIVARDVEFEGASMKAGERAFLFLPGADLDQGEFTDPGAFDLQRENKVHIAFGVGPHRCVGSHLARLELQVFYEEFLSRIPQFRLDPDKPVRYHGGHVIGPDSLHLLWDAG